MSMKKLSTLYRRFIILRLMLTRQEKRASYLKKLDIFMEFGENVKYGSATIPAEPYLVKIHNNVRIAASVSLITHDIIDGMIKNMPQYKEVAKKLKFHMGTIEIMDNCMIGSHSVILPNVKIGPNAIVAAGSIVTKDVPSGTIVGGNPARVIGQFDDYVHKRLESKLKASDTDSLDLIIRDYWGIK